MTNIDDSISKAERQIDAIEGVMDALGKNLQKSYETVVSQLSQCPDDTYLVKKQRELDRLIDMYGAVVSRSLLAVGICSISKEDVVRAVRRL